jgi:tetratricopeptide (TPR) repeat protein
MRLAAAAACALLAACAARTPAPPAPTQATAVQPTAAMEANRRAEASLRRGELEAAALHYREALRLSLAVEDAEGIAANAVNLSIVQQRQGKYAEARATLAPLLERATLRHAPAQRAQAALRRAVLDLEERRYAGAAEWAARAADWCGTPCALAGPIRNVQGQLALAAGRLAEAAAAAAGALAASRAAAETAEIANAQRLLGMTALAAGDGAAARAALGEALALDRELGIPRRIFLDLIGLGGASRLQCDSAAARGYYARARAVSEANRDAAGSAEARALLDALDQPDRK